MAEPRHGLPLEPAGDIGVRLAATRGATERLVASLSAEDCALQSMAQASPAKWHLAHTTWFFETFVLGPHARDYRPFNAEYRALFNSYYRSLGAPPCRARRGLVSRPTLDEVRAYRRHVDQALVRLTDGQGAVCARMIELGIAHEQQHQELILSDLKHAFFCSPLRPRFADPAPADPAPPAGSIAPARFFSFPEGLRWIGHAGPGFAFDNEEPRHRVFIEAFRIAARPVSCGELLEFIEDGGYRRPAHWLSDGWDAVRAGRWSAPLYWEQRDGRWWLMTPGGMRELDRREPACHVSFYEADAYARWAGARLPSEAEWECAAAAYPTMGQFADSGRFHPAPSPPESMLGDVWSWTASAYAPYPGYRAQAGALGEYNGKFMCNQMVLRGGSCATPRAHIRTTYRNYFQPDARWQFTGLRLARDGAG